MVGEGHEREQEKWQQFYASLPVVGEDTSVKQFNDEFAQIVSDLLPTGGRTLESGCGAGYQSLGLARTGKYDVSLLDFAPSALAYAQKVFAREGLSATFHEGDGFKQGEPEYDLVFNAGALEHYTFQQQVDFLRGMASRSRNYVMALVPNSLCYWYWLFRVKFASEGQWAAGKEIPLRDLSAAFEAAGMRFLGNGFLARQWTEVFIADMPGIEPRLKQELLEIHRLGDFIPVEMKSYLVAGLGTVDRSQRIVVPAIWKQPSQAGDYDEATSRAMLADTLASKIASDYHAHLAEVRLAEARNTAAAEYESRVKSLEREREAALRSAYKQVENELERVREQAHEAAHRARSLAAENARLKNDLDTVWASRAYRTVRGSWALRRAVRQSIRTPARVPYYLAKGVYKLAVPRRTRVRLWESRYYRRMARQAKSGKAKPIAVPGIASAAEMRVELLPKGPSIVNILAPTFFNFDGHDMFCGGAERYLIELCKLVRELGYSPQVYQNATRPWVRYYEDIPVFGVPTGGDSRLLNRWFHQLVNPGAFTVYFAFFMAMPEFHSPNIGISHGVYWDHNAFQLSSRLDQSQLDDLHNSIKHCDSLVSVDTNTINWVRATLADEAQKFVYIPNFVDTTAYAPVQKAADDGRIVIVYPRRLYGPRGFWLVAENIPYFMEKHPQTEFHFVGKGDAAELAEVERLSARYPDRIRHYNLLPDRMHEVYKTADITLIPTVASEGTSLSCIEGMASGNAIIATNVGGLPDLIIDGYNGLLIEPDAASLRTALERLIIDDELRRTVQHNARAVSLAFDQGRWHDRWLELLKQRLAQAMPQWSEFRHDTVFIYPRTAGVTWGRMRQRPHQLMQALARKDYPVYFVSDASESLSGTYDRLQIVDPDHELYVSRPVLYIHYTYNYREIEKYTDPIVVYDILDAPEIHASTERDRPADDNYFYYHERLLAEADVVLVSAKDLYERFVSVRPDIKLVPNGVAVEDFQVTSPTRPRDLPSGKRPVVGYYGAIAEWFDYDLLAEVCRLRPDYEFVLIGITNQRDRLDQLLRTCRNLHYLGEKPYEELPGYLHHFSAAMIPFVVNTVTHATSPVKLFEYSAGGVPTVATPMRECARYDEVLTAASATDFAAKLDDAIRLRHDAAFTPRLHELARANTWSSRARQILDALNEARRDVTSDVKQVSAVPAGRG